MPKRNRANKLEVRPIQQDHLTNCWKTCLSMIFNYLAGPGFKPKLPADNDLRNTEAINAIIQENRYNSRIGRNLKLSQIKVEINSNRPFMIGIYTTKTIKAITDGHSVVCIGYVESDPSDPNGTIIINDPDDGEEHSIECNFSNGEVYYGTEKRYWLDSIYKIEKKR